VPTLIVPDVVPKQEAAVNRSKNRLCATAAGLVAGAMILTGCSAGQISQTANQEAAVNGNSANAKSIALRNVHLLATQSSDYLQPGRAVPLVFVAANNSPDVNDKLLGITSDVGAVAMTGDAAIPARAALVVAAAGGQTEAMGSAAPAAAEVTLNTPITNGLSYDFTFSFEHAGKVSVAVPISAGD